MQNIHIERKKDTPSVILNADEGIIEFEGKSYPGDTFAFYKPLLEWVKEYFDGNAQAKTMVNFKLLYFNSATSQTLYDFLDLMDEADSTIIVINWYYEGEDKDSYEDYEELAEEFENLTFNAVAY